jgi:hypothetical protein
MWIDWRDGRRVHPKGSMSPRAAKGLDEFCRALKRLRREPPTELLDPSAMFLTLATRGLLDRPGLW